MKSGKTKPFRPHGDNVVTEHYRLDADDDDDEDHGQDLREAIMNPLNEVSGASEEQTCVVSSLTAAGSKDAGGSQHETFEKATAATATSSSTDPPGRWRRARAKLGRKEINKINERTEKATWEKLQNRPQPTVHRGPSCGSVLCHALVLPPWSANGSELISVVSRRETAHCGATETKEELRTFCG